MRALLLLFIVIPIAEMWLLITVGSQIGALPTIFLVFLTAVIGLALLRQQGVATLFKVNQRMQSGQLPATEIMEGVVLAVGGALLLTPGFLTDAIGFICLFPISRRWLLAFVIKKGVISAVAGSHGQIKTGHVFQSTAQPDKKDSVTLDGEFRRED